MINKTLSFIALFFFSLSSLAEEGVNYLRFYDELKNNSSIIKVKQYEVEAEYEKSKQTKLYFLPQVDVSYTAKQEVSDYKNESKISANSTLYSSDLPDKFEQAENQLLMSKLALHQEEEKLYRLLIENVISIKLYTELLHEAQSLKKQSIKIYEQISTNYALGLAKASDQNQGKLLIDRLQTDIESIEREIELFRSNIEQYTGVTYPESGVYIDNNTMKKIEEFIPDNERINNNTDLKILRKKAIVARSEIGQQSPFMNINIVSEYKQTDNKKEDDSYIGLQAQFNVFNYNNISNKLAKEKLYLAAQEEADNKYKELISKLRTTTFTRRSNIEEMKSLQQQIETTENILDNQMTEYDISQSSYYEMLNTRYDLFSTKRKLIDKRVNIYLNSIEMLQISGELI